MSCEDFEENFDSDSDRYNRFSDMCSKESGTEECEPYEAEDYTAVSGCKKATNYQGFGGAGYMDFGGNGTWIEWNNIAAPVAGEYTLTFRYANGGAGNRQAAVIVGGQQKGNLPFAKTFRKLRSTNGFVQYRFPDELVPCHQITF